jgi:hypothetical protein
MDGQKKVQVANDIISSDLQGLGGLVHSGSEDDLYFGRFNGRIGTKEVVESTPIEAQSSADDIGNLASMEAA